MKTLALIFFVFIAISTTYAQKGIDISIKTTDGKLFKQDANIYTMPTIKILGLKTEADFKNLETTILENAYVAKFQYLDNAETDGTRNALLCFKGNDEKTIINFFKSINVNNININDKTFSINQTEELKAYIRELKTNKNNERSANAKKSATGCNE